MNNNGKGDEATLPAGGPTRDEGVTTPSSWNDPAMVDVAAGMETTLGENRQTEISANDDEATSLPSSKRAFTTEADDDVEDHAADLERIWEQKGGDHNKEEAIQDTWNLISKLVDGLIQVGIAVHQELEGSNQKLKAANEECTAKAREIERLRAAEQKSRESIAVSQERTVSLFPPQHNNMTIMEQIRMAHRLVFCCCFSTRTCYVLLGRLMKKRRMARKQS
jgi:hypothetical protein